MGANGSRLKSDSPPNIITKTKLSLPPSPPATSGSDSDSPPGSPKLPTINYEDRIAELIAEGRKYRVEGTYYKIYDKKALSCFNEALKLNPNSTIALAHKASTLRTLGKMGEALIIAEKAYKLAPNNLYVQSVLAGITIQDWKSEKFLEEMRKIVAHEITEAEIATTGTSIFYELSAQSDAYDDLRDETQSLNKLKTALKTKSDIWGYSCLGYKLYNQGLVEVDGEEVYYLETIKEAVEAYRSALKIDPNIPSVLYVLGVIYEGIYKHYSTAHSYYLKAHKLNPHDVATNAAIGQLYYDHPELDTNFEAVKYLNAAWYDYQTCEETSLNDRQRAWLEKVFNDRAGLIQDLGALTDVDFIGLEQAVEEAHNLNLSVAFKELKMQTTQLYKQVKDLQAKNMPQAIASEASLIISRILEIQKQLDFHPHPSAPTIPPWELNDHDLKEIRHDPKLQSFFYGFIDTLQTHQTTCEVVKGGHFHQHGWSGGYWAKMALSLAPFGGHFIGTGVRMVGDWLSIKNYEVKVAKFTHAIHTTYGEANVLAQEVALDIYRHHYDELVTKIHSPDENAKVNKFADKLFTKLLNILPKEVKEKCESFNDQLYNDPQAQMGHLAAQALVKYLVASEIKLHDECPLSMLVDRVLHGDSAQYAKEVYDLVA